MNNIKPLLPRQTFYIQLDLEKGWVNSRSISLKQADNETRFLIIRLTNLLPLNIADYQPVIFVKRTDGQILKGLGQVLKPEQGEFAFKLTSHHLAVNGSVTLEVVLTKDENKIISFPHFSISVADSLHDEDVFEPSEEELSILWEIIGRMQNAYAEMEEQYNQFEQDKNLVFQANESNRQQAETIRQQGYVEMQGKINEVYSTTLKYRIVE